MIKIAKGPPDPVQQKLRSDKKVWNTEVSAFIADLFAFKDMMNGKPSKFFKQKSKITEPIPNDPASMLGMFASRFQEIVQKGNAIVQEQISYSKTRRKKQPKSVAPVGQPATVPAPVASPADLSKQLGASKSYDLVSTASSSMESGYIFINDNIFPTLLAISSNEQAKGLMNEPWPPPVMSFVYAKPTVNKFWMKSTPSPLDIVFCCNGTVSHICKGEPLSTSIIGDDKYSDLVIEFPRGTVEMSGIKVGQKVGMVKPTADELKIIIAKKI